VGLSTYDGLVKQVLLRCPAASLFLARSWVDYAFRYVVDYKLWSWQRRSGQFLMPAVTTTGTVDITRGSLDVVGHGTSWTQDLVNQQFRVGLPFPIYTIVSVDDAAQTLVLDAPWGGSTTLSVGYQIYQAYVTVPTDFQNFLDVVDMQYNWRLAINISREEVDSWDAQRATAGTAYTIVNYRYDTVNNPPLPMYEIWPHQKAQYVYPFYYVGRPPDLSDDGASLPRPVPGDLLLEHALGQAAKWPGASSDSRNVYFNLPLAMEHERKFNSRLYDIARTDDEIMMQDVSYSTVSSWPIAAFPLGDARYLQSHDY
jgi:hypothetical protein